ncbi:unnamed protein product [Fraxinus pennsylvanica]|uniref:Uncharacterized protein n=1 Tax=Fraxinus pennsylvanica TaxID=56036 RepID=A0AAD1YMX2_9LAMI|nr:unnamed protein product [Fraxinus pennsylvanica]
MFSGKISSFSKKSELKIGESATFSACVNSSNNHGASSVHENASQHLKIVEKITTLNGKVSTNIQGHSNGASLENHHKNKTILAATMSLIIFYEGFKHYLGIPNNLLGCICFQEMSFLMILLVFITYSLSL